MSEKKQKHKRHKLAKLCTIIGTDLLTAKEKFVHGDIGGLYKITDELAYVKGYEDKASMSVSQFDRYLKKNVHSLFTVVYNDTISPVFSVQGHSIYYNVPKYNGVVPICKVGRSADSDIPAHSQGKIAVYKGQGYKNSGNTFFDEEPLLWRGWVAAFEACKAAYDSFLREGIHPSRVLTAEEVYFMKNSYEIEGFAEMVKAEVKRVESSSMLESQAEKALEKVEEEKLETAEPVKFPAETPIETPIEEIKLSEEKVEKCSNPLETSDSK